MSEKQLNNGSQEEAQSMPNCTDGKSGNSLINKINAIKRKAKKNIADFMAKYIKKPFEYADNVV